MSAVQQGVSAPALTRAQLIEWTQAALGEAVWSPGGGLHENTRGAGETVAFGDNYVHDVRNPNAGTAVSVTPTRHHWP